jgi:hypothetical protein
MNTSRKAILLPLIGLAMGWVLFMFASWSDLFIQPEYDPTGAWLNDGPAIRPSTYLYLLGITVYSVSALLGLQASAKEMGGNNTNDGATRAAYRFGNLNVIIGLAGGAVFALVNFLSAFRQNETEQGLMYRLVAVYLPILLATGLVVTVLLFAFVFRKDHSSVAAEKTTGMTKRQKALGLGYSIPIIAGAIAIIFGLVVFDITQTSLDAWVWVIIQVIIAAGIILGTRYARMAKSEKAAAPKPRTVWASGAWNLNFVLSIVFGGVVSVMAFVFGSGSFEKLRDYNFDYAGWEIKPLTVGWLVGDFAPALVLIVLVVIGLYATITERHRNESPTN